jgi:type VI secretion system secreted protein VgrG
MPTYTQTNRPLAVTTPLGTDVLLLTGFDGREGISQLFSFRLSLVADVAKEIAFDKLLGQPVSVRVDLLDNKKRYFSGICSRFRQGESDTHFTDYYMEVVPALWFLTRRAQSRIFQHVGVPDILKAVLKGLDVTFELQGTFQPRDYCVQYRESDFHFASRLMEEEGIYYFFKHSEKGHQLVVANTPQSHAELPLASTLLYKNIEQGAAQTEALVSYWAKTQELTSGKVTLWDHCFELPHKHLEAEKTIQESVAVGGATHKLKVADNGQLEVYDYPGAYAQRFDGIDRGGGDQPADVQKIFEDNKRTTDIRMQQEAVTSLLIDGRSNYRNLTSGFKFKLALAAGEVAGKALKPEGEYVLTAVTHTARMESDYRSGDWGGFNYQNSFQSIPFALPFRPTRKTEKPVVPGSQTAVVVGPAGEEIFTDKYSRVKVQFHWDRQGKGNADSSCWVRVATHWAGKQWGIIHIPRIGQEVVVDFLEGDPDQPIIVGSVYNAEMMPPYALPGNKTQSGVKSRSSLGGSPEDFNEIMFEDKKGSELLYIRAQKDQTIAVENDEAHWVGHDRMKTVDNDETTLVHGNRTETVDKDEKITIHGNRTEVVDKDETITIHQNRTETVDKNETITIHGGRTETVDKEENITIHGGRTETVDKNENITISGGRTENVSKDENITIGGGRTESVAKDENITISGGRTESVAKDEGVSITGGRTVSVGKDDGLSVAKNLTITAGESISITTGSASIVMNKNGTITISGKNISIQDDGETNVKTSKNITMKGQKILHN